MNTSTIFANLTPEDYRRFEHAGISYSGSTGAHAKPEGVNGLVPYIASYEEVIPQATAAMGWKKFSVEVNAGQWIVRCEEREPFTERTNEWLLEKAGLYSPAGEQSRLYVELLRRLNGTKA
jgi:hypothetical protein